MYFYLARACHSENASVIILLSFLIFCYFLQGLQSTVVVEQWSLSCGRKKRKENSLGAMLSLLFCITVNILKETKGTLSTPLPVVKRHFRNNGRDPWEWLYVCLSSNWLSLVVCIKPFQCQESKSRASNWSTDLGFLMKSNEWHLAKMIERPWHYREFYK